MSQRQSYLEHMLRVIYTVKNATFLRVFIYNITRKIEMFSFPKGQRGGRGGGRESYHFSKTSQKNYL